MCGVLLYQYSTGVSLLSLVGRRINRSCDRFNHQHTHPQGICNLYEKDDSRKIENKREKLVDSVYPRLVALLPADDPKRGEIVAKLLDLYATLSRFADASAFVDTALIPAKSDGEQYRYALVCVFHQVTIS